MISQAMLINKILQSKDYSIISTNNLISDYFFNYKAEFEYIVNHYSKYNVVPDSLTFVSVFPNFDVVEVNEPNSFLLEQLFKDYNTSNIAKTFNSVKKLIESGKEEEALQLYKQGVEKVNFTNVISYTDLINDTSRYDRYLERTSDPTRFYLTTGFCELDAILGGIDRENENMVIIARPGIGKTQVLLKMAATAYLSGLNVGIYEGEMTPDKVGYRIDTFIGHIFNTSINRGDLYVQKEYKKYIDSLKSLSKGTLKLLTPNDVPSGIVTVDTLRAFIEKEKLDILFVDQYSLLDDLSKAKSDFEHIGNIAKAIKKLQVEKKIPIISVSQMNRTKNENGEQDTTQVAGSDKIPQYATTVIALEQKQEIGEKTPYLTLNIIKARDGGEHNSIVYSVNFNSGRFNYIPSDKDGITSEEDVEEIANSYEIENEISNAIF